MATNYKGTRIDNCANPKQMDKKDLEEIRGMFSNSLQGFRCKICGAWWKIYQNECHSSSCKYTTRDG